MPIEFVSGDLFANRFQAQALAHGCNCQGSMGAGIATGIRGRYPEMYDEYQRRCKAEPREFNLGDAFLWKSKDHRPWVFNLGTQEGIWRARASYEAIETALKNMRDQAGREGIKSIALPRIGAGYGGLSWKKVRGIIDAVFHDWTGNLYVYEDFAPEEDEAESKHRIVVESRRRKHASLEKSWPGARIVDVTSRAEEPWVRFSPFYPHGGIPVPNSPGTVAQSVEGLWQGLKVFEKEDIDPSRWAITSMRGIKRGGRARGKVLGHRFGVASNDLLGYRDARLRIYLPAYRWVLENRLVKEVKQLRKLLEQGTVVLLDYETNSSIDDLSKPLSHAALIRFYLQDQWPGDS